MQLREAHEATKKNLQTKAEEYEKEKVENKKSITIMEKHITDLKVAKPASENSRG